VFTWTIAHARPVTLTLVPLGVVGFGFISYLDCLTWNGAEKASIPARRVELAFNDKLNLEGETSRLIRQVEIRGAANVRIVPTPPDCSSTFPKPAVVIFDWLDQAAAAQGSRPPTGLEVGTDGSWELALETEPAQLKMTISAPDKAIVKLTPSAAMQVQGLNCQAKGFSYAAAEGKSFTVVLYLDNPPSEAAARLGSKSRGPKILPTPLGVTTLAGKIATDSNGVSVAMSRWTSCTMIPTRNEYESFRLVAANEKQKIELSDLTFAAGGLMVDFNWTGIDWAEAGKCGCRCLQEGEHFFGGVKDSLKSKEK